MTEFELSQAESAAMTRILGDLSCRAGRPLTLDGLLTVWAQLVDQVEKGYPYSIYDYTNDLAVRGLLNELLESGGEQLRTRLLEQIQPLDQRFLAVTKSPEKPLQAGDAGWWLRIPKLITGELEEDLLAGGHLENS